MSQRLERTVEALRANGVAVGFGVVLVAAAALGVRWVAKNGAAPPPRKVMQFTVVQVQPTPPPKPPPPPPPPPTTQPKVEEPDTTRVSIKATDLPPPDAPPPQSAPAAGPLALAAEGDGPGDAFNLAGNPGGRALTSGGALGDGTGGALGGAADPSARYGWYYGKIASEIQDALGKNRTLSGAATRVEVRVWADGSGRIRLELVRSTGDPRLDEEIRSTAGLRIREPPPGDIPMPMILRITARRPG